jgi:hypothetical protein
MHPLYCMSGLPESAFRIKPRTNPTVRSAAILLWIKRLYAESIKFQQRAAKNTCFWDSQTAGQPGRRINHLQKPSRKGFWNGPDELPIVRIDLARV